VGREVGVPAGQGESDWWSLDHLFIDQDAIPTFVECKRSSDARGRREVVAQMLDYAANGTEYWTADRLRQIATETADKDKQSGGLDEKVRQLVGATEPEAVDQFWLTVEENLRRGAVRLVFVSDEAPRELLRLAEFLNEQMKDTEVLVVEVKQFRADAGQKVLVPRVLGRPERTRRPPVSQKSTNREEFLSKCTPDVRPFFEKILNDAGAQGYTVQWGKVGFSVRVLPPGHDKLSSFAFGYPPNRFEVHVSEKLPEIAASRLRQELTSFGLFSGSGQQYPSVVLSSANLALAGKVWSFLLERIRTISTEGTASETGS
jgi:hypothetical protein